MTDDNVMTREETMAFVSEMLAATFRNKPMPNTARSPKKYIRPEHLEDAMDRAARMIAEHFDSVPAKVSDDFEVQEVVRQKTDEMIADMALAIRQMLEKLTKRP